MTPMAITRRQRREQRAADDYRRCTPVLTALLRREYPALSEDERSDVVSECWEAFYKAEAEGEIDPEQYDGRIEWLSRAARLRARHRRVRADRRQTSASDPQGATFTELAGGDTEEEALEELDRDQLREFAESLEGRDRQIFVGSFALGMKPAEIQEATGIPRKAYERANARMHEKARRFFMALEIPSLQVAVERLQTALANGEVNQSQLLAAEKIATDDPSLRAALDRYQSALHALGVVFPVDAALRELSGSHAGLLTRLVEGTERTREAAVSLVTRGGDTGVEAGASAATGAGAAGTGGAIAVGGGKLVAGLCAGATATACVAAGVIPGVGLNDVGGKSEAKEPVERTAHVKRGDEIRRMLALEDSPSEPEPAPAPDPQPEPAPAAEPAPAPAPEPAPAPAPDQTVADSSPVAQEFEPVGTPVGGGSSSTSSTSSSSSGGGGSVGGDFGP